MIDRLERLSAVEILKAYRDGEIDNETFHTRMRRLARSEDRSLRAIESMLWNVSDDYRVHFLTGTDGLNAEGRNLFSRCMAFLESELEYEWSVDNFVRPDSYLPVAHILTLGFTLMLSRRRRKENRLLGNRLAAEGDFEVWPFLRRDLVAGMSKSV